MKLQSDIGEAVKIALADKELAEKYSDTISQLLIDAVAKGVLFKCPRCGEVCEPHWTYQDTIDDDEVCFGCHQADELAATVKSEYENR